MASKKNSGKGKNIKTAKNKKPDVNENVMPETQAMDNLQAEQPVPEPAQGGEHELTNSQNPQPEQAAQAQCARPEPDAAGKASAEKPEIGPKGPRMPHGISVRPLFGGNPYMPMQATVMEIVRETGNIRTLRLTIDDEAKRNAFEFQPGQVGQISVFGAGEATFVINSPPSQKHYLQFSIMKAGELTDAIHQLSAGDKVGLRAPLGNYFPWQDWQGKNVFFIGGGIGMAPIRTIMLHLLERKADYGKISLLYGARSPHDMAYSYELDDWMHNPDLNCTLCIDNPHDEWPHKVGLIPSVLEEIKPSPDNTVAVLCGPPIMIKFTLQSLQKLGFEPQNIITTLEKRMKCGIGICGRCNIGDRYVCVDGPVFTMQELNGLPADY